MPSEQVVSGQVVIAGGGLAGAATALVLARRGIDSVILEAAACIQSKIGETLPPNVRPLIKTLGLDACLKEPDHLSCYGNKYLWGGEEVTEKLFIYHTQGNGWHLNRLHFEEQVYQFTRNKGIQWHFGCKVVQVEPSRSQPWRLTVDHQGNQHTVTARFFVDATGRTARLARLLGIQREHYDRLVGLACAFPTSPDQRIAHHTYIEAVENGWWYAALLPGNRFMTVFMTDADLLDKAMLDRDTYRRALRSTRLIGPLVPDGPNAESETGIITRTASSSHLRTAVGTRWLAVGDAAFAYDPISSYGLASALSSGFYAGNAIADHLRGKQEALPAYTLLHENAYHLYLEMLANQYRLEQRWPEHPFWKRRHGDAFTRQSLR